MGYNIFGSSVPLCQMISTSHTALTIKNWLTSWKEHIKESPHEIITDDSSALIRAVIETFTEFETTADYIQNSFKSLEGIKYAIVPKTFIRLDTSHFTKSFHDQACFKVVAPPY